MMKQVKHVIQSGIIRDEKLEIGKMGMSSEEKDRLKQV